jgi:hypothetical protein
MQMVNGSLMMSATGVLLCIHEDCDVKSDVAGRSVRVRPRVA